MSFDEETESETETKAVESKVGELTPRSRQVNLTVKVVSKSPARDITSRSDGSAHRVADALVGDETGSILMTLWDDKIDGVKEADTIDVKNGYVSLFRGSMRLNTGRYGSLEPSEKTIGSVNTENNLSEKQFEQERRFPTFRPLYGDRNRGFRGGGGRRPRGRERRY